MLRPFYRGACLLTLAGTLASAQERTPLQDDFWREFDLYRTRLLDLARMIPAEKYGWRPGEGARSVGEVIVHVSMNNYMLLEMLGRTAPAELYPGVPGETLARWRAIAKKNAEWEKTVRDKAKIIEMSEAAWNATAREMKEGPAAALNKPAMFMDRKTTLGGLQLRVIAHLHEHLGQLIAYARSIGVVPPWSQ